jgi:hypothetical protein
MDWVVIIILQLMLAAGSCGLGLLVVTLISCAFTDMAGYIRTGISPADLKQKIEEISDSELRSKLKELLVEWKIGKWWAFLVWLIVSSVTYAIIFLQSFFAK